MDRVGAFLAEKTPRRLLSIAVFLAILYLFRELAVLLVFFMTFERALKFLQGRVQTASGLTPKKSVLVAVLGILGVIAGLAWLGIGKTLRAYTEVHSTFPDRVAELREHPLVSKLNEHVGGTDRIVEAAKHYAENALGAAEAIGHFFLHVLIGFILAVVFILEEEELARFWETVDTRSLLGTVGRWIRHVGDATVVTVQLQLVVAACNTLFTLPVLIVLGIPHVPALMILIFVSALVPVLGNIASGTILSLLAYQQRGWLGVGVFVALTFVLHKIESYYLNPRLTARHVHIPGFLLIVSLLACEHLFGFKGLFLSFPILFVTGRIRKEFADEDRKSDEAPAPVSEPRTSHPAAPPPPPSGPSGLELEKGRVPLDSVRPGPPSNDDAKDTKDAEPAG
jgi:predicted PurR-regulated permease PerM